MEWMYYLLEANLYLLLFFGFYKLFLQHETFYNSNRYFLLLSSATAFVLPVLQLGFLKPAPIVNDALFPPPVLYTVDELASMTTNPVFEPTNYSDYLYPIYLLVAFVFATKLIFSLVKIISLWAKADKKSTGKITIIELDAQKTAFSFFNLLFIHPHLAEKETVFKHELVHIKQKHSLDILFFEILQIICWFNPIIYFLKKDVKLLHEYIADDLSTNQGMQKHEYALFLIENSFGVMPTPLTNQIFNQSILKRRINMLNKKRTANWARLRLLLALPLAGGMLCISTMAFTKSYGYVDLLPEKSNAVSTVPQQVLEIKKSYFPVHEYDEKNNYISLEKRLIVINGKQIVDNNKYYGTSEADEVIYLNSAAAIKKYGNTKGKYGAVEIIGEKVVNTYPPLIASQDNQKSSFKNDRIGTTHFFTTPGTDIYGNPSKVETRYVVINGKKIDDFSNFYGVTKASKVVLLNSADAVDKYGSAAKLGAIEIQGNELKYVTTLVDGPPPPPENQVKFPPPVVRKDKTKFYPMRSVDKKGNVNSIDLRTIVINGKKVEDLETFYGVTNATNVIDIDAVAAIKKYGKNAKYGAVEITGTNLKYVKSLAEGPPPPIMEQVKFPPPIVKPTQQKKLKAPPAIEPPPAGYKNKQGKINKTPNLNPTKPNVTKVVQGYPLKKNKEELREVTVVGYGSQSNATKVVQGFPINSNGDQLKEAKIRAYPQSNTTKVVQGYPINSKGDQIKDVKVQGYPQSRPTKVVQGYPINNNNSRINDVKAEGSVNQHVNKSNEPVVLDGNNEKKSPYQTKLSGLASPQSLVQKPTAYTLRGNANSHRYVTASTSIYLSGTQNLKKNK